jgi:MFS family permease
MKNKSLISFLIMLVGSFLSGYFGPWWAPAVFIVLAAALSGLTAKQALGNGALSLGIVYLFMASWMNTMDQADIIGKTGMLMGGLSPILMIVVTTLIGAVTGLLSGWLGSALGKLLTKK